MSTQQCLGDSGIKADVDRWLRAALENEPLLIDDGRSVDEYVNKLYRLADFGFVLSDSALAGLVAFYLNDPSKESCYISTLVIGHRFRRMGFARGLLEYVDARAQQHGARSCQLRVHRDNCPAQKLYARYGYTVADGDAEHVLMHKEVRDDVAPRSQRFHGHRVLGCSELCARDNVAVGYPHEAI